MDSREILRSSNVVTLVTREMSHRVRLMGVRVVMAFHGVCYKNIVKCLIFYLPSVNIDEISLNLFGWMPSITEINCNQLIFRDEVFIQSKFSIVFKERGFD